MITGFNRAYIVDHVCYCDSSQIIMPRPTKKVTEGSEIKIEPRLTRNRKRLMQQTKVTVEHKLQVTNYEKDISKGNSLETKFVKYSGRKIKSETLSQEKGQAKIREQEEWKNQKSLKTVKIQNGAAGDADENSLKTKRKKTDEEKRDAEMAGFVAKGGKFVGAHTSSAGGVWNAVTESLMIKGRAFGLFLKSQRQWKAKPLEEDVITKFKSALEESGYHADFILPHGSYLLNCGSPNPETLQKSRDALLEEVQRCQRLGLKRYNFHPGSTCGEISVEESLDLIGESINNVLKETSNVTLVVENMSCQGNTVGGKFEELKGIIDRVKDKSRIGVCLDTCHAFAAGYDLSTDDGYNKMTEDFDQIIGFQYLKGVHLNDSKGKVGCHLDRHENIGKGFIGLKGFKRLMNDSRFEGVPMILETPAGNYYEKEINLLCSLVD